MGLTERQTGLLTPDDENPLSDSSFSPRPSASAEDLGLLEEMSHDAALKAFEGLATHLAECRNGLAHIEREGQFAQRGYWMTNEKREFHFKEDTKKLEHLCFQAHDASVFLSAEEYTERHTVLQEADDFRERIPDVKKKLEQQNEELAGRLLTHLQAIVKRRNEEGQGRSEG